MSFDVTPPPAVNVAHLTPRAAPPAQPAQTGGFAKVYDLAAHRRGVREVPPHVWDEVDRAAQIASDLDAAGRAVRFREPEGGGRVRAELVDAEDTVLRPLSLGEVITIGSTDPPTAA